MVKSTYRNSDKCPVTFALDVFGDKWSLLILRDIIFKEKKYYGDFLSSPEKIATNILASRLQKLEAEGLIAKSRDPQNGTKFIYCLTQKGKDLLPVILEMVAWSAKYDPQPDVASSIIEGAPENLLQRLEQDRQALIEEILEKLGKE
ncbi:MAG: winged helix-turn-helix transcriptional regulator [Calditrichia bacterium]